MGPSVKYHSYGRDWSATTTNRGSPHCSSSSASPVPLVKALAWSQISGRGVKSIRQLPRSLYSRFDSPGTTTTSVASLCLDLESALVRNHVEACQRLLANLLLLLSSSSSSSLSSEACRRELFVLFGGDVVLRRALVFPFVSEAGVEKRASSSKVLAVRRDCLSLLHELCVSVTCFAHGLAARGDFVLALFGFMYYSATFEQAVALAEDLLAAREQTLRVQDIPDFANLVRSFSPRQLASFCRVLAMVSFEPEAGNPWMEQDWSAENAFQSMQGKASPEEPEWTVADENHDAILLVPDILARLVHLLSFDKLSFTCEGFLSSEALDVTSGVYMESVLESVGESGRHDQTRSFSPQGRGVALVLDEDLCDWNLFWDQTSPTTVLLLSHHVEILFVLCALCGGKKREQVQNALAELGLVAVLNDMFEKLDWTVPQPRVNSHGIHGHGCACNPNSALKIQYLRLIHNFCDRDSCNRANKLLLMQPCNTQDGSSIGNKNGDAESEGLIVKILKVLVKEPADSLYRFWLASCVEAFLRGANNKDQEFVASHGLMEHLVHEILKGGFRCAPLLQINFDLLGELIKFNKPLFQELNKLLAGSKFDQFVEVLVANLVDSNVFVRSVVLSLDYFKRSQQPSSEFYQSAEQQATTNSDDDAFGSTHSEARFRNANAEDEICLITSFVSHNTHRLLRDLMCTVRLNDINQDNICVLNTALVFFIFAEKNGELQGYLQTLRASDARVPRAFRALLEFWRGYYLWKRGRECVSLQYSTQLPFSEWQRIVDSLCAQPDSPYSLLYTGSPVGGVQCGALTASSEPPPRRR